MICSDHTSNVKGGVCVFCAQASAVRQRELAAAKVGKVWKPKRLRTQRHEPTMAQRRRRLTAMPAGQSFARWPELVYPDREAIATARRAEVAEREARWKEEFEQIRAAFG